MSLRELFPPLEPYDSGRIAVDDIHTLYWEEAGNPDGPAILFLHGGPGAGCGETARQFFDPAYWRIILFDQRGSGRSTPLGELRGNTTENLVADIEKLRVARGIEKWHIFGGSWGSTLALAYGETHPDRCLSFILRGIFTMRKAEVAWYIGGLASVFPDAWAAYVSLIPEEERGDVLGAYLKRLTSKDESVREEATRRMLVYETSCASLISDAEKIAQAAAEKCDSAMPLMEAHYLTNNLFTPDSKLLDNVDCLRSIPCIIVQGRYDMICPMTTAYELHQRWPEAQFVVVPDAGHSAFDPGMRSALIEATERMKAIWSLPQQP